MTTSKKFTAQTAQEFKQFLKNGHFHRTEVKSINNVDIKVGLEVSNKHVSHYVGGGEISLFKAPFNILLK